MSSNHELSQNNIFSSIVRAVHLSYRSNDLKNISPQTFINQVNNFYQLETNLVSKMNSTELDECFEFVNQLVLRSGETLKEGFKNTGQVKTKGAAHDLVTFWDGEIERILMDGIKEKYPSHK